MRRLPRIYDALLEAHLDRYRQMAFVSGPRQVGKTTTCQALADLCVNWDDLDDRARILAGPSDWTDETATQVLGQKPKIILFDELHKYPRWKTFLKSLHDRSARGPRVLVTGSSRLDVYRRGGDSLMGRYFLYRMHPLSIAELNTCDLLSDEVVFRQPTMPDEDTFDALFTHGGFPEPLLRSEASFDRRWHSLRLQQLVREDIRDMTQIQQLDQLDMLARMLIEGSSQQINYTSMARQIRVAVDTARRWVDTLANMHLGWLLRPWHENVRRSLRKEPKWYARDWSTVTDVGARAETFVACHLIKAVDFWNDSGLGRFEMGYLRDKSQREVDFIVVRDGSPWFLVEVKQSSVQASPALEYFQSQLEAPYAFQAVMNLPYIDADCFEAPGGPLIVPVRTLLSQLV
jgi:uncharacterized protein